MRQLAETALLLGSACQAAGDIEANIAVPVELGGSPFAVGHTVECDRLGGGHGDPYAGS